MHIVYYHCSHQQTMVSWLNRLNRYWSVCCFLWASGRELTSIVSACSNILSSSELISALSTSNNVQTAMAYDYNNLISSSVAAHTNKVQHQVPHYSLIYVLIFVFICIFSVIIEYFSKEKWKLMRFISNISLFHNLKPINKYIRDSGASDYLVPNTSSMLMSCSQDNGNSDTYKKVLYDRSESSRISVSTNL